MVTEHIEDFVLASDHNIRIAEAVFEAWPKVRQKVARVFLEQLRERLKKKLKNWDFDGGEGCFENTYSTFCLWKPNWDYYGVALQFAAYGEKMQLGVYREKAIHAKRPFSDDLLQAIKKHHPSARSNVWWEALATMRSPATDWRTADVLWRMHKDTSFLDEVAEQLLEVARTSEPIVDRLVRKK